MGRVDFVAHGLVVEFDGLVKYSGQDGRAALAAEKARESGSSTSVTRWSDSCGPTWPTAVVSRRIRPLTLERLGVRSLGA